MKSFKSTSGRIKKLKPFEITCTFLRCSHFYGNPDINYQKNFWSLAIPDLVVTHVYFQILSPPSRNSSITAFFTLIPKYLHYYQRKHSRNSSIILLFWSGVISFQAAGTGRRRFALFFGVLHVGMGQLGGRRN